MNVGAAIDEELAALGAGELRPFDAHSHTGHDIDGAARSAEEHLGDLEAIGGRSVIFPLCVEGGYDRENERVLAECGADPGRLIPFARLDPHLDGAAEAEEALTAGARGIKLHPRAERFRLDHPNVEAIFAAAAGARAPVLIHAGVGVGSLGRSIVELARSHREAPIILAHAGISDLAWIWREVEEHPNVYFDTAWWNPTDLLALFALVPPGRVLYGSDAPYMDVKLGLALTIRAARFAGLGQDVLESVLGGQLEALLSGAPANDLGPAPGPVRGLAPAEARVAALLTAAGGCLVGDGDPGKVLELTLAASASGDGAGGDADLDPRITELVAAARAPTPARLPAIVLALSIAHAPGVGIDAVAA